MLSSRINTLNVLLWMFTINFSFFLWLDRERSIDDVTETQQEELQWYTSARFIEDYTSGRFWDWRRRGRTHPLVQEYSSALVRCALPADASITYIVAVDADGALLTLEVTSTDDEACVRSGFAAVPFQSLAPLTGKLVLSGQLTARDLNPYANPTYWSRAVQPEEDDLLYNDKAFDAYQNGAPFNGRKRAEFTVEAAERLDVFLQCSTSHELVWVDAEFNDSALEAPEGVTTWPRTPCIEEKLRERWRELPAVVFEHDLAPTQVHLHFNHLTGPQP